MSKWIVRSRLNVYSIVIKSECMKEFGKSGESSRSSTKSHNTVPGKTVVTVDWRLDAFWNRGNARNFFENSH